MDRITAKPEDLMHQAGHTAEEYMSRAVKEIDDQFGPGYAAKHPELVAAFMQTCAMDYGAAVIMSGLHDIADAILRGDGSERM